MHIKERLKNKNMAPFFVFFKELKKIEKNENFKERKNFYEKILHFKKF